MSEMDGGTKICPFCAETIGAAAKICPVCGSAQQKGAIVLVGHPQQRATGGHSKVPALSEEVEMKPCAWCAEPIRVPTKVCPYCRRLQPRWRFSTFVFAFTPLLILLVAFAWVAISLSRAFGRGEDFENHRAELVIVEPEMHFSRTTNGNFVSVVGQIRNDSAFGWKELQLEAQFYNASNRLIDTRSEITYAQTIRPGETNAFRVRGAADKPESSYVGYKVFIRGAWDVRSGRERRRRHHCDGYNALNAPSMFPAAPFPSTA